VSRGDPSGAVLAGARLDKADLSGAELIDVNLSDAQLDGANLSGACSGSQPVRRLPQGANLSRGQLNLARLFRAFLPEAVGLTPAQVELASGNARTVLPKGLGRPSHWRAEELEIRLPVSEHERDTGSDPGQ
jgi:hypothetical protein